MMEMNSVWNDNDRIAAPERTNPVCPVTEAKANNTRVATLTW